MKKIFIIIAVLSVLSLFAFSCGNSETAGAVEEIEFGSEQSESLDGPESKDAEASDKTEFGSDQPESLDGPESKEEETFEETEKSAVETLEEYVEKKKEKFTSLFAPSYIDFTVCLPENHEGNLFVDMGVNCMVTLDEYDAKVAAYVEYDNQGPIESKTVNGHTYEYQHFCMYGIKNWQVYVIKIAFTGSRNQMEHRYIRIVYNVYANEDAYDDSQVEEFMKTIVYADWLK